MSEKSKNDGHVSMRLNIQSPNTDHIVQMGSTRRRNGVFVYLDDSKIKIVEEKFKHKTNLETAADNLMKSIHDLLKIISFIVLKRVKRNGNIQALKLPGLQRDHVEPVKKVLQLIYSKKTYEAIFQEALADWAESYYEALNNKQFKKATLEKYRGYLTIFNVIIVHTFMSPVKWAVKLWKMIG